MTGSLIEIFSSIQGEGLYVGTRQIFTRFAGCNMECAYCDTEHSESGTFRIEEIPGTGRFIELPNPVTAEVAAGIIRNFYEKLNQSLSLTGGEPLLQAEFIKALFDNLKETGIPFFLETNGTMPAALNKIISFIDIISMDIKLPSTTGILNINKCGTGSLTDIWEIHKEFLLIGSQKNIYVKTVISSATTEDEIIQTCEVVKSVNRKITLVLQPVTTNRSNSVLAVPARKLIKFQELALSFLKDVRVIPQTHKYMGQL